MWKTPTPGLEPQRYATKVERGNLQLCTSPSSIFWTRNNLGLCSILVSFGHCRYLSHLGYGQKRQGSAHGVSANAVTNVRVSHFHAFQLAKYR